MKNKKKLGVFLFILPAVIVFFIYFVYPIGFLLYTSFMAWDGVGSMSFTGLSNYERLIDDHVFHKSLMNTLIWGAAAVFIHIPLALLLAIILSYKVPGWKFFRTVFFFPNLISTLALSMMWLFIYNGQFGLLNAALELVGLEALQRNWLGEISTAFPALIAHWLFYVGIFMVIFMAFIATIDKSIYEAAEIDGANIFQRELFITLPLLKPGIAAGVLLAITNTLKNFEAPFVMTNGGPVNETMVMALHIYRQMVNFNYGYANTLAIMLILAGGMMILVVQLVFREKNA
jgi:raffinose/stachyose/melibiose transport system permease protein